MSDASFEDIGHAKNNWTFDSAGKGGGEGK